MNTTIMVSDEVARHLDNLSLGRANNTTEKLRALLEAEYRRQLTRYSLTDRQLRQKYGMSFEEFERQQLTKLYGYTWDVESDAMAWETAVDGICTIQRQLHELLD